MAWQPAKNLQKHNYVIDMLRCIAAFMVVMFHLNRAIAPADNWYRNIIQYGWLGVPVFFVVSGYCIILSAYNSGGIKDFLCRRLFRIFPPYWVSILVVLAAACFQKLYIGSNAVHFIPRNLTGWLAALSLTTSPISGIPAMNWVYWTLSCELFFYLTICLVSLNKKFTVYLLIAISLIAAVFSFPHAGILFFLEQWPAFGLGMSIYYFFKSTGKITHLSFTALLVINLFGLYHNFSHEAGYIIFTAVTAILIFTSNYINASKNIFAVLGQYSYSVYLIHVPIGVFVLGLFESPVVQQNPLYNLIHDIIIYAIINIFAWLMFIWVEKPSINYGRKIAQKYFHGDLKKHTA